MKILFTGASSFTGMWFVEELAKAGHDVTCTFTGSAAAYGGLKRQRIERIRPLARAVYECRFGSDAFVRTLNDAPAWDLFCCHGAEVTHYKSPDFDFAAALASNTHNLREVLRTLSSRRCSKVLLTGSVFEQEEGAGTLPLRAVSPYGLSKGMTTDAFRYFCSACRCDLGKFVIPNPFGPFEESRFTSYLITSWLKGETPSVHTPKYIRDNIHVSLLAKAYAAFALELMESEGEARKSPSQYREAQGLFTARLSNEMRGRLGKECRFTLEEQRNFTEPLERVNTATLDPLQLGWNESEAWDQLAEYYRRNYG